MPTYPLRILGAAALLCVPAFAQCPNPNTWIPGGPLPGPGGRVLALARWDPDGAGPLGEHVVCGGAFTHAGTVAAANIALYEPTSRIWSPIGAGFDGTVHAALVTPSGEVLVGGAFTQTGTTQVAGVARWNGTTWVGLGSGVQGPVYALTLDANGDLYVGGDFTTAGGIAARSVARWNGATWSALGSGLSGAISPSYPSGPYALDLDISGTGELLVAGAFTDAGGIAAPGFARWNGSAWNAPAPGIGLTSVNGIAVLPNGDEVVHGFTSGLPLYGVRRWNGATWTSMNAGNAQVMALHRAGSGALLAAAQDPIEGTIVRGWNGTAWQARTTATRTAQVWALLELPNGEILLGAQGDASGAGSMHRWAVLHWEPASPGIDRPIRRVLPLPDASVVVAGAFEQVGNAAVRGIARWQGGGWSALGGGVDGDVDDVVRLPGGDLIVGGSFGLAGAVQANGLARWDGAQWQAFPGWLGGRVTSLLPLANGDLVVAGPFSGFAMRWNGSQWQNLNLPPNGFVRSMVELPSGDLVVGLFNTLSHVLQRWDGTTWTPFGATFSSGNNMIAAMRVLPNGNLVVAGKFTANTATGPTANIAQWNGTAWVAMGAGLPSVVTGLDLLPNGDLVAAHADKDAAAQPVATPSRWNGASWQSIAGLGGSPECVAASVDGDLWFAGSLHSAGGQIAGSLARLRTGCPASELQVGTGCNGSSGPLATTTDVRAWLGGTFRARTAGLPPLSIGVQVLGLSGITLPLAMVLPAPPGCTLHVSPDVVDVRLPTAGAVTTTLPIPATATLLGRSFRHQLVSIEIAPGGAFTTAASANAYASTIGVW